MRPRVTIGLPVYNGENFLSEAIESLRSQTFENLELIVADNASNDGTEEIVRAASAGDSRIVYHRHPHNLGAAANYNFTVEMARGEFFMWAAHDDLRAPDYVERTLGIHAEQPETSVVFSRVVEIDENGTELGPRERHDDLLADRVHRRFRGVIISPHPSIVVFGMMRLETMKATGQHGTYIGSDRVLAAELALLGPFAEIQAPLFFSRNHPSRYGLMAYSREPDGLSSKELWWDPQKRSSRSFPRWRRMGAFVRAVGRYPLTLDERLRCYGMLAGSLGHNRFASAKILARELITVGSGR